MTELQMDCFGSVMLLKPEDPYCKVCPLLAACQVKVDENRAEIESALSRPVFEAQGKFWASGVVRSRQRRALAVSQSTTGVIPPASKPKPAPKLAVAKPEVIAVPSPVAPLGKLTPYEAMTTVPDLKKKVIEQLNKWVQKGIDPSAIEKGVNPFATVVGCGIDNLITRVYLDVGQVSKRECRDHLIALQTASGGKVWEISSLQSNINIITDAYRACGYELLAR